MPTLLLQTTVYRILFVLQVGIRRHPRVPVRVLLAYLHCRWKAAGAELAAERDALKQRLEEAQALAPTTSRQHRSGPLIGVPEKGVQTRRELKVVDA